jgi:hypothetical protein
LHALVDARMRPQQQRNCCAACRRMRRKGPKWKG